MRSALDSKTTDQLRAFGTQKRLDPGRVLFRQGDVADSAFLILSGRCRVVLTTPSGRELLVALKSDGELMGELSCIDGRKRSATAVAEGRCHGVTISRERFREALAANANLAFGVLEAMSTQLRRSNQRFTYMVTADTTTRVAAKLIELCEVFCEHHGPADSIDLRVSQEDLAAWIGSTRESVARSLGRLRAEQIITTGRQRISVQDPALLEAVVLKLTST